MPAHYDPTNYVNVDKVQLQCNSATNLLRILFPAMVSVYKCLFPRLICPRFTGVPCEERLRGRDQVQEAFKILQELRSQEIQVKEAFKILQELRSQEI